MNAEDRARLPQYFEELWAQIRGARLLAGQPRNAESVKGVELAEQALRLATAAGDQGLLVDAWRMLAYSLTANEQYPEAVSYYEKAIPGLEAAGQGALAARTRIGYVFALTHSGRYGDALAAGAEAERWFKESGDDAGYARLCSNIASLYQRLDRYQESHDYYAAAARIFESSGNSLAAAQVYLNMGYTLARIDRFEETERMYESAERMAIELGMEELWAQASYNHAYFHFLLGRYSDALQSFAKLRGRFKEHGSTRHFALCDLDEAEIYLQLNLATDAASLAQNAVRQFENIGMLYEEAKARAFHGVALMQMGRLSEALETFRVSQEGFASEGNEYWVAVLDLYRAEVHLELQRFWEAHSLADQAWHRFRSLRIPSRQMLSLVVLGRIALALGDVAAAERFAAEITLLRDADRVPLLRFPYHVLRGRIAEHRRDSGAAAEDYRLAAEDLEAHQSRLQHDDLRVTFLNGRHQVYESLVRLSLDGVDPVKTAYSWCERAKSRGLVELLSSHLPSMQPRGEQSLLKRVHRLREELNLHYVESRPEARPNPSATEFETVLLKEQELARALREVAVSDPEYVSLQTVSAAGIESVQSFIPATTTLLEYFIAQDEVIAFVITRDNALAFRQLAPPSRIQALQERLSFQLEKFLLGPDYVSEHSGQIQNVTDHYLMALHELLVKPILPELRTRHLTVIPHGPLHFVPFHAFWDGEMYLLDRFEFSYAPSASVLRYCMDKPEVSGATPLILGFADELAPMVDDEVRALGALFTDARKLVGPEATRKGFSDAAKAADFIHVATHATFRQDNPMFSSFKLADGYVTALDLFSMNCQTNLVALSGCKSGLGEITGSDDLLGLMRGFLFAGARSLLLSLWSVNDESTVLLMQEFYKRWRSGMSKSKALQGAMVATRDAYPNPFYWAPFILVGKA